ncbi:MAG: NfeD family protein [Pseudodesulfovibrio sp.]|nr:NfeD family protein [Pseudodesulfovibrio sp.]
MDYFASMENILWLIWLAVGVAFLIAEIMVPGFIMIFFGIGALIAGATAFFGSSLQLQIVTFGVSSLALILLLRRMMASTFRGSSTTDTPSEEDSAIGALAEVVEAITPPHRGRIKFQGTFWTAEASQEIKTGITVRIISRHEKDHNTFTVEKES